MKFVLQLFILTLLILFSNCKKEVSSDAVSNVEVPVAKKVQNENKPVEEKAKDSLNSKNVAQFLSLYGNENKEQIVLIKTRLGNIKIQLYKDTPQHRASFIFLIKMGYFDTTCFYRVVPDFVIQGGESERLDTQRYKARYERYKISPEFRENRKHKYGAVALARDWKDNPGKKSTAFEFYIVQNRKGAHHLDGEHTVFGEVISGFETIDKIVNLEAGNDEWPLNDVFMKIEVIK